MGKKIERLSLLSGGERSLAAVALLTAIFKARPSPFYILDEVEAATHEYLDRRAGRPSLTGRAERSPQVTFRVTPELKARAEEAPRAQGTTVSQLARKAFEQLLVS